MNTEDIKPIAFYQNLGKLFYAIASSDGAVEDLEVNALKTMVAAEWSISPETFAMVDFFNWLHHDQDYDAATCFKSFVNYLHKNTVLFTPARQALILKTARHIAGSFSGTNKSELILLAKLELEFKKLKVNT